MRVQHYLERLRMQTRVKRVFTLFAIGCLVLGIAALFLL